MLFYNKRLHWIKLLHRAYNDVLKYYIEMEKSDLKGYEKAAHRGRDGDLPVEFPPIKQVYESFLTNDIFYYIFTHKILERFILIMTLFI